MNGCQNDSNQIIEQPGRGIPDGSGLFSTIKVI